MITKANNHSNGGAISLNETFFQLATGALTLGDIIAERRAARSALIAKEDAYVRRRRERAELADPFVIHYCH